MKRSSGRVRRIRTAVLGIAVVAALLIVAAASASPVGPGELRAPAASVSAEEPRPAAASVSALQADDGGPWEVGFETAGGSLWQYACSEGTYLRNRLTSGGWVSRFSWCGGNAFEEDFKRFDRPGGGKENNYLDQVDLMFYVGHGSPWSFTFDSMVDDHDLTPSDCYDSWGDIDNEWVGLTSCQVLGGSTVGSWAACMNGTHLVLGFITNASARMGTATQGYNWAYYISKSWTVNGAWFKACDVSQPAGRKVRVLGNELGCYNDRPWTGYLGCADSYDTDWWYWDHTCGSEMPQPMDVSAVTQMPVFKTPALSLAEAEAEFTSLGQTFGLPAVPPANASAISVDPELWSVQQNDLELEMERQSGLFTYYDMNLWSTEVAQAALAPRAASISADDAQTIAEKFLRDNDLMPPDAQFYEVTTDKLTGFDGVGAASTIVAEGDTVYQVIYSRWVTATVPSAAGGPAAEEKYLVVGPGAKLKVYVPMTATLASAAQGVLPVAGVQGGWRNVLAPTAASAIDTVPILTEAQVKKAYEEVESFVVLNTPPIDADGREVISPTLAYWEEGVSNIQSQLIPTYGLYVKYTRQGELLNYDWAYIPANETYMRPYAKIVSGPTVPVRAGTNVMLTAADASMTLAELGHDAILNFTLGSGTGPYLYDWFIDSISEANKIGQGKEITYKVRPSPDMKAGLGKQTIILRVTDSGSDDLRNSIATYLVDVFPRVMLPLTTKN